MKQHLMQCIIILTGFIWSVMFLPATAQVGKWMKYEKTFESDKLYTNPLYDVRSFFVVFTSSTGRIKKINGFWDGDRTWKVRFAPDESGTWTYHTTCSDTTNKGLHQLKGSFVCESHNNTFDIYTKGAITHAKGSYYLTYADGSPFFYAACTAWNGALKSTEEEWHTYLQDRVKNNYNVIQFVTTQWRGCDVNSLGQTAFEGSGKITLNPAFFQHLDKKIDQINSYGLVAAPVLLWALQTGRGRELSPGYHLPDPEAILLAKYLVARYGGNQVIWILGGDGKYINEYEQRWKNIGRAVFGEEHPGVVAMHSQGKSWIGKEYSSEEWVDIIGYQSGHNNSDATINWINLGPVAKEWSLLPPKVFINMEPCYEEIFFKIQAQDVRNASYWSLLSTPVAGIAYGANGIWPWLRPEEDILNHEKAPGTHPWYESIKFPGSVQIGYLAKFMRNMEWWRFKPAADLLAEQPGIQVPNQFITVAKTDDNQTILAYVPANALVKLYNPLNNAYNGQWFNPISGQYMNAILSNRNGILEVNSLTEAGDKILILMKGQGNKKSNKRAKG